MYGCESWTIKKTEHWRIDAFELWCWRRFLRVPGTSRRSNQSILKEISPEYSLEGLMLKLKLQYFGYLIWRADSLEKTLILGKIEGRRRSGQQRKRWLDGITDLIDMSLSKHLDIVKGSLQCCSPWGRKESDTTEQLKKKQQLGYLCCPLSCLHKDSFSQLEIRGSNSPILHVGAILAGHRPLTSFLLWSQKSCNLLSPPSSCWADGCKAVAWPLLCIFAPPGVGNSGLSGLDPWLKSSPWVPFEHLNTHFFNDWGQSRDFFPTPHPSFKSFASY